MSWDYRSIMSGRRRDPLSALIRGGLGLASLPYRFAVGVRNRRYDRASAVIHRSTVPVISVGNLTTGGTGKTPIVCFLAKWFRDRGVRVAIVSRGYGRGDQDANDEAMELHARLPDVPHVQDPDRVEAARIAVEELDAELILMDDGFQHRRLYRDLDIVVIDATCPFGFGHLLPRGLLREPVSGLSRADLVIVSRCGAVDSNEFQHIQSRIQNTNAHLPVVRSDHRPTKLLQHPDMLLPVEDLRDQPVAVLSAIGNPDAFMTTVRGCGAKIIDSRALPDHDAYSPDTVRDLGVWIESLGESVTQIVCTHKDLVKLRTDRLGGRPISALVIELAVVDNNAPLNAALEEIANRIRG